MRAAESAGVGEGPAERGSRSVSEKKQGLCQFIQNPFSIPDLKWHSPLNSFRQSESFQIIPEGDAGGGCGETALAGFLQIFRQHPSYVPHGVEHLIRRNPAADSGIGQVSGGQGIDGADDIAFYTGDLNQACHWIAGKPQKIL